MSMGNKKNFTVKKYFDLERKRRKLALEWNLDSLISTYNSELTLENRNTEKFWDKRFQEDRGVSFPMEVHRNKTAYSWFLSLHLNQPETLNIGCGDGNFEKLLTMFNHDIHHIGIDIAKNTVKQLRERFPKFRFFVSDVLKKKIPESNLFDVIFMFEVLEHIPPQRSLDLLEKVNKRLKNNGFLLVSVPINEGLEELYPYNPNEHLRCYSLELLKAELFLSGFTTLKFENFYAFHKNYYLKTFIAKRILINRWKPNNILVLAQKRGL